MTKMDDSAIRSPIGNNLAMFSTSGDCKPIVVGRRITLFTRLIEEHNIVAPLGNGTEILSKSESQMD